MDVSFGWTERWGRRKKDAGTATSFQESENQLHVIAFDFEKKKVWRLMWNQWN
jgi:hypothetical protein